MALMRACSVRETLAKEEPNVKVHGDKTAVCMEGPAFSTRAESLMYRAWGGDLINMSALPEAKLARDGLGGGRVVSRDHRHADAGGAAFGNGPDRLVT